MWSRVCPILAPYFLSNEWWNIGKKLSPVRYWNTDEKESLEIE